jgi:hypothetical protein
MGGALRHRQDSRRNQGRKMKARLDRPFTHFTHELVPKKLTGQLIIQKVSVAKLSTSVYSGAMLTGF